MRAKLVNEAIQEPFSNSTRNKPINGSYPLSKIQYESADSSADPKDVEWAQQKIKQLETTVKEAEIWIDNKKKQAAADRKAGVASYWPGLYSSEGYVRRVIQVIDLLRDAIDDGTVSELVATHRNYLSKRANLKAEFAARKGFKHGNAYNAYDKKMHAFQYNDPLYIGPVSSF